MELLSPSLRFFHGDGWNCQYPENPHEFISFCFFLAFLAARSGGSGLLNALGAEESTGTLADKRDV